MKGCRNTAIVILLLYMGYTLARADSPCKVDVTATKTTSWGHPPHTLWDVKLVAHSNVTSLLLLLSSTSKIGEVWGIFSENSGYYTLPEDVLANGGIAAGATHTFEYIIRDTKGATITVSHIMCGDVQGMPTTFTPPSAPTTATLAPTPTSRPTAAGAYNKVCDVVLVIDNYIVRAHHDTNALRAKYTNYFAEVDHFYQANFKMKLNLTYMHFEKGTSFSDAIQEEELLDSFREALVEGVFGTDLPDSVCTYHLITGRDVPDIGGLAWIGTACDTQFWNTGFTSDLVSEDAPIDVIKRMIHEIGHGFGGQHYYYYSDDPLYTCDAGIAKENDRALRSAISEYEYIDASMFITECATNTITNSLPSFSCIWSPAKSVLPSVTLYVDHNFKGVSTVVKARNDVAATQCYNIVYPYGNMASSFKLSSGLSGIRFFSHQDCIGKIYEFSDTPSSINMGSSPSKQANSFQFIYSISL